MSSFLGVFLQSFVYLFNLITLPLFWFLPLFDVALNYLPQVAVLFQSYAMLIFLSFFVLVFPVLIWLLIFSQPGLKPYPGLTTTELMAELKKGYRLEKPNGCSHAM